jgi:hypothetical protein
MYNLIWNYIGINKTYLMRGSTVLCPFLQTYGGSKPSVLQLQSLHAKKYQPWFVGIIWSRVTTVTQKVSCINFKTGF